MLAALCARKKKRGKMKKKMGRKNEKDEQGIAAERTSCDTMHAGAARKKKGDKKGSWKKKSSYF